VHWIGILHEIHSWGWNFGYYRWGLSSFLLCLSAAYISGFGHVAVHNDLPNNYIVSGKKLTP